MSQVARIKRISFRGVPAYLGEHNGNPIYSGSPQKVADWMCDGFRTRFNQLRSQRSKYVYDNDERVLDDDGKPMLAPIGLTVTNIGHPESRKLFPHLSGIPSLVLEATEKLERTDWFSATKRRKTRISKGKKGGKMPGFRSRKRGDRRFACWFNGGKNAVFHRTGKKSGMVVIRGKNPPRAERKGQWELRFHIHLSQEIRPYTRVEVDLARNQATYRMEKTMATMLRVFDGWANAQSILPDWSRAFPDGTSHEDIAIELFNRESQNVRPEFARDLTYFVEAVQSAFRETTVLDPYPPGGVDARRMVEIALT